MTRRTSPSADRNKKPIFDLLETYIEKDNKILEIASGTGQHGFYFCQNKPDISWQPSDINIEAIESINDYHREYKQISSISEFKKPIELDICDVDLEFKEKFHFIVNINMIHISPITATHKLFEFAEKNLIKGGYLYMYGPYIIPSEPLAPSNQEFDLYLKSQNKEWGIRSLQTLENIAKVNNLYLHSKVPMPANNFSLFFKKKADIIV